MPTPENAYGLPFNPYGLNVVNDGVNDITCRIVDELHNVQLPTGKNASFVVPLKGPFFGTGAQTNPVHSVTVKYASNGNTVPTNKYVFTHRFNEASFATGKQIYGSIAFIDREFAGDILITYTTLGGKWVLNNNAAITALTQELYDIRTVTWSQVVGIPYGMIDDNNQIIAFPPIVHDHAADDLTGMVDLIAKLEAIRQTLITNYSTSGAGTIQANLNAHIAAPTAHSPAQVGLGEVLNLGRAEDVDYDNNLNTKYATPYGINYKIEALQLKNGSVTDFTVGAGSPVQPPGEINLKNGAFKTVSLPIDPPAVIPADTLPLQNGAFTQFIVSATAPVDPIPGTIWLKPNI
jgi:hypothetical protein